MPAKKIIINPTLPPISIDAVDETPMSPTLNGHNIGNGYNTQTTGSSNIAIGHMCDYINSYDIFRNIEDPNFLILDLWGNVSEIVYDNILIKQAYINGTLIRYEDSIGNYWDITIGVELPYKTFTAPDNKNIKGWFISEENGNYVIKRNYTLNFPSIKRIMSTTLSQELVSVAPMSAPTPNLFYFDYVYTETKKETWLQRLIKFVKCKLLNIYD